MTGLLTDNLPLLAGVPNGIQKLRQLILELAVRGKLVSQDPSDEPASELLKRIAEEKARLVAEGKIRKQKPLAEIGDEEKPFELPEGWEWVRVAAVGHDWGQKTPDQEFTYIDVGSVDNSIGEIGTPQIVVAEEAPSRARKIVRLGTIIYSTIRPYLLNVAVIDREYSCEPIASTAFAIIHPYLDMPSRYFLWYLRSPVFVRYVESVQTGIAYPAINDGHFFSGLIPLPPLAEQQRIVAKVDELMALCDRLAARQSDAESAHARLVQALLDSLTQASDANDFAASWQRLAEHFHSLFTSESSIDALKQTLLQLAVMGKLVPQDPGDEPASELLKRIAEEKVRLVAEGKLKRQKPLAEIGEEEKSFELPEGWEWARLGSQVVESGAGWSPNCEPRPRECNEWGVLKVSAVSWGVYQPAENKALPANLDARPEHEVAEGDFLVSRANTAELVARSVVVEATPSRLMLSDKIVRLKLTDCCDRRYINLVNSAPLARQYYARVAGGTSSSMKNVSREQILNLPIALPPLAEQYRIVARFDSIVALCDTLKRKINAAAEKQMALLNAFMPKA